MDRQTRFYRHFQEEVTVLQEHLESLDSVADAGGERHDAIETILTGISRLSDEVSDAADFVPAHDQRTYAEAIKAITDQLNETTAKTAPRSRFKFKNRVQSASNADTDAIPGTRGMPMPTLGHGDVPQPSRASHSEGSTVDEGRGELHGSSSSGVFKDYNAELKKQAGEPGVRKPSFSAARDITLSGHDGLQIILPATASRATTAGTVTDIRRSVIDMWAPTASESSAFAGLVIKEVSDSLVCAGNVNGPAHLTGLRNCVVSVAARQVRIHECHNVDVYLYCASRPIIEDCSGMRFAPLPECHRNKAQNIVGDNQWDQVDDFKWLKAEASPNWSILPEPERLADEVWSKKVRGGPGIGVKDILKEVGVKTDWSR